MILDGRGFQKSNAAALSWYQKAAKNGSAHGEAGVGWMYENGFAVPKDRVEAISWYLRASDHGNDWAKERLQQLQQ